MKNLFITLSVFIFSSLFSSGELEIVNKTGSLAAYSPSPDQQMVLIDKGCPSGLSNQEYMRLSTLLAKRLVLTKDGLFFESRN